MDCIICGGSTRVVFSARDYRRPSDRTERTLRWCKTCKFGRLDFDPADIASFYEMPYYTHTESSDAALPKTLMDRATAHLAWRADRGSHFDVAELGPSQNKSLCDIGCGSGGYLSELSRAGFDVVGIEPDPIARKVAQQFGTVYDGTAETLPREVSGRKFDIVFLSHVFEHCANPCLVIENIKSILKNDGMLVLEVPNNAATGFKWFGAQWPWADIPRHLNFFTEKSLISILAKFGLSISETKYAGYFRQFSPEWLAAHREIAAQIGNRTTPKKLDYYKLLARTAFATPAEKYDSIRVHCGAVRPL